MAANSQISSIFVRPDDDRWFKNDTKNIEWQKNARRNFAWREIFLEVQQQQKRKKMKCAFRVLYAPKFIAGAGCHQQNLAHRHCSGQSNSASFELAMYMHDDTNKHMKTGSRSPFTCLTQFQPTDRWDCGNNNTQNKQSEKKLSASPRWRRRDREKCRSQWQ